MNIPVLKPTADEQTKRELLEVIDSGWWGQGPKTAELEVEFAKKVGAKYAIATNSCTAALDLCLKAYDIQYGELITPAFTFVADAIVGEWNGMEVTFADIDRQSYCLDPKVVPISTNTRAIIAVHSHGRLADIKSLRERFAGLIIEDCAHAMYTPGAGRVGDIAVWSFQAVKTLPAGDGGMITTDSEELAIRIKNMTWLGIEKSTYQRAGGKKYSWDYDIVHDGVKAYMNDINAVLALGNLRRLDAILAKRMAIQEKYNKAFSRLEKVVLPEWSATCQYYTLELAQPGWRDIISDYLAEWGITTSVHFKPLSEMTYWRDSVKVPLPVTNEVWPLLLSLPCHDALTDEEQDYVIEHFKEAVSKF